MIRRKRKALASVLALIFLVLFATLALGYWQMSGVNVTAAHGQQQAQSAEMAAESGLAFICQNLKSLRLPYQTTDGTLLANLHAALGARFNGTANLAGGNVDYSADRTSVVVPQIPIDGERAFTISVSPAGSGKCLLKVTGTSGSVSRTIQMQMQIQKAKPGAFNYAIASRGGVAIWGNCSVTSANDPADASILSTKANGEAVGIHGSVTVSGDLYASGSDATISVGNTTMPDPTGGYGSGYGGSSSCNSDGNSNGKLSVGGTSETTLITSQHVHVGVEEPDFPAVDTASIVALAGNNPTIVRGNVSGSTYSNILIPANSSTTFGKDTVLNGIIIIEAPNTVVFKQDVVINGIIVGVGADSQALEDCQIIFKSNVTANGVEALQGTEWQVIRQQKGTFVLAPGFGLQFHGQMNSVCGSIVADQFGAWGNTSLTVKGYLLALKDATSTLNGGVEVVVDHENAAEEPAGMKLPLSLVPSPETFSEGSY